MKAIDELDENQLGYVNAGYSANNAQERAEVLVNNIIVCVSS